MAGATRNLTFGVKIGRIQPHRSSYLNCPIDMCYPFCSHDGVAPRIFIFIGENAIPSFVKLRHASDTNCRTLPSFFFFFSPCAWRLQDSTWWKWNRILGKNFARGRAIHQLTVNYSIVCVWKKIIIFCYYVDKYILHCVHWVSKKQRIIEVGESTKEVTIFQNILHTTLVDIHQNFNLSMLHKYYQYSIHL